MTTTPLTPAEIEALATMHESAYRNAAMDMRSTHERLAYLSMTAQVIRQQQARIAALEAALRELVDEF